MPKRAQLCVSPDDLINTFGCFQYFASKLHENLRGMLAFGGGTKMHVIVLLSHEFFLVKGKTGTLVSYERNGDTAACGIISHIARITTSVSYERL